MLQKEALARISINKLLEDAGWRFFPTEKGIANIQLEPNVKIKQEDLDGIELKKTKNGFVDYLLLDENGFPFVVVEAKKDAIHPLDAKEQARKYANSLRCKYIILTNGSIHYFWNLEKGNPEMITSFPTYESLKESKALTSDIKSITDMKIDKYFVALSQEPSLETSSAWKTEDDELITEFQKVLKKLDEISSREKLLVDLVKQLYSDLEIVNLTNPNRNDALKEFFKKRIIGEDD